MMKLSKSATYAHGHDLLLIALIGLLVASSCTPLANAMFLSIDCGASDSYTDEMSIKWVGDEGYVHSGESQQVAFNVPHVISTLRVFSTLRKNCYTVPVAPGDRILVRATFYYGNYDGTKSPPSFDLYFDANYWTNVNVSGYSSEYTDYEVIYTVKKNTTSICLAQTLAHQIPFISSLEFRSLGPDMYTRVGSDVALFKTIRIASGEYRRTVRYPEDRYDRVWYSGYGINAYQVSQATSIDVSGAVDDPPAVVLQNATTGRNTSEYYQLFSHLQQDYDVPVYITTYFSEVLRFTSPSYKRSFRIYVDNNPYSEAIIPPFGGVKEVAITNITASSKTGFYLMPTSDATLPVLINAFEVYTLSDPLSSGTHIADVEGLRVLQLQFEVLIIWSGDPCLPSQSQWEWVQCSTGSIPRIISLNLSSFGLIGLLPDFSSMDALVTIDLHENSLTGSIPEFLGSFPNLKKLDLSHNRFNGAVPPSLSGKNLSLVVTGNCLTGMSCPPPPQITPPPAGPDTPSDAPPSTSDQYFYSPPFPGSYETPPGQYYFGSTGNKNTHALLSMLVLVLGGAIQALHYFP